MKHSTWTRRHDLMDASQRSDLARVRNMPDLMHAVPAGLDEDGVLAAAGLSSERASAWSPNRPVVTGDYRRDVAAFVQAWRLGAELLGALPPKASRAPAEAKAAALIHRLDRSARDSFLHAHVDTLYRSLTRDYTAFVRVEDLVYQAAERIPGLVPSRKSVAQENRLSQRDKEGIEIDQGIFLSRVLAHSAAGTHLCHAMLLPRTEALEQLSTFRERGVLDLGATIVERRNNAAFVTMRNPRFLNAEDDSTIAAGEIAIDLATLDPAVEVAVLRGDFVDHP